MNLPWWCSPRNLVLVFAIIMAEREQKQWHDRRRKRLEKAARAANVER